ncbi:hypothetical protein DMB44_04385 [Thermoplasma sp. Kam2015]|uniref:hypothetical protein n=1 Tax=Thermoplasma sp. Kam2015 TaxID=2094122 RepID=UPI000D85C361|nr:hypothetical protein [Thermoplasma sp. Kam2015]PYB68288.1 hypothetical protein DMB44_04385 [Thermoplasma sp. Kam2015]
MPLSFLPKLVSLLKKGVEWLTVRPDKPDINFNTSDRNIRVDHLKGQNITINIYKEAKDYDPVAAQDMFTALKDDIENHQEIGLQFDPSLSIVTSQKLIPTQRNKIELFKKVGWKPDKLASIKIAFKIINLEDSAQYEEAESLMKSAFNGRKKSMNKKFYNLARSGYLEGFAMQLMISSELHSDEAITKILDYFPEAIFIDDDMDALKFIQELQRREQGSVRRVSVYARGENHITGLNYFYDQYLKYYLKKGAEGINLYILTSREEYKIGASNAVRIELELKYVKTQNF